MPSNQPSARAPGPNLVFAGGGSGGHIFPGLAIAEEVARLCAETGRGEPALHFVTSDRAVDAAIMREATRNALYSWDRSPARPMIARPAGLVRFAMGWFAAKSQARYILRTCQDRPETGNVHVVAMGGFVAAPLARVAKSYGLPVTMVNLDAVPGKANRDIARRADRIFTATRVDSQLQIGAQWTEVPPIVRSAARATRSPSECRAALNLDPSRPVLMITGGSQGLRSLNEFVTTFAASPAGQRTLRDARWQVLHQTGRNLADAARAAYQSAGIDATVVEFNDQMGLWWGAADAAVCTAGAGNIAEIWMNKVPALLLPYPHHKDEHQKFNAAPLVEAGGALLGKDWIDAPQNLAHNAGPLESLLAHESRRAELRANLEKLGPADGATRIARALLDG